MWIAAFLLVALPFAACGRHAQVAGAVACGLAMQALQWLADRRGRR